MIAALLLVIGLFCLIYGIAVLLYAGITSAFHFVWPIMGAVGIGLSFYRKRCGHSTRLERILLVFAAAALIFFAVVEGRIVRCAVLKPSEDADYMVVLGCQVKGTRPSRALAARLDAAIEYLRNNPKTRVIVTGGKGFGEEITEAECMRTYLLENGIEDDRILLEDQSTSTVENIRFARKFFDPKEDRIVVVTNGFHLFRAISICRKQGVEQVEGCAGETEPFMIPTYYLREFCAVVKDAAAGNISF